MRKRRTSKRGEDSRCSLLVEARALYERSRFHRPMLSPIVTSSREKEKKPFKSNQRTRMRCAMSLKLLLSLCSDREDCDHRWYISLRRHRHRFPQFRSPDLKTTEEILFCESKRRGTETYRYRNASRKERNTFLERFRWRSFDWNYRIWSLHVRKKLWWWRSIDFGCQSQPVGWTRVHWW